MPPDHHDLERYHVNLSSKFSIRMAHSRLRVTAARYYVQSLCEVLEIREFRRSLLFDDGQSCTKALFCT